MRLVLHFFNIIIAGTILIVGCMPPPTGSRKAEGHILPDNARFATLTWRPDHAKGELNEEPLSVYKGITFSVISLVDLRKEPGIIGKTLEDKKVHGKFVPLATKTSFVKWCKSGMLKSFQELNIATDTKHGTCRLEVEILEFSIDDNITQKGNASLRISATTENDLLIWEGKINGIADLYDRPKDTDGISECLSNTMLVTVYNLLIDQSFSDAIIKAFELK